MMMTVNDESLLCVSVAVLTFRLYSVYNMFFVPFRCIFLPLFFSFVDIFCPPFFFFWIKAKIVICHCCHFSQSLAPSLLHHVAGTNGCGYRSSTPTCPRVPRWPSPCGTSTARAEPSLQVAPPSPCLESMGECLFPRCPHPLPPASLDSLTEWKRKDRLT